MRIETGEYFQHDRRSGVGQVVEDYPAFPEHRPVLAVDRAGEYFPGRFRRRRQNELRGRRLAAGDRQHGVQPDQLYGIAVAPVEIAQN